MSEEYMSTGLFFECLKFTSLQHCFRMSEDDTSTGLLSECLKIMRLQDCCQNV
jgi:hypothetical protein